MKSAINSENSEKCCKSLFHITRYPYRMATAWDRQQMYPRGELSYLAPLGSENISAPYFKQCFFQGGGGYYPPD